MVTATLAADDPRHGKYSTYSNYRCRCKRCTAAWTTYCRERRHRIGQSRPMAEWRAEQKAQALANMPPHGTESRYTRYKCKCELCKAAGTEAKRRRREAKRVPCVGGCGTLVSLLNRRDKSRPPRCHPCATALTAKPQTKLRKMDLSEDDALIQRAQILERARTEATGELAELIQEQERDERWGHRIPNRPWLQSLDAPDRYGRVLLETFEAVA